MQDADRVHSSCSCSDESCTTIFKDKARIRVELDALGTKQPRLWMRFMLFKVVRTNA